MTGPKHVGRVDGWRIIGNRPVMLRGRGHRMAQGPCNGLINQTVHLEIRTDAFGVMELDAPLEDLAHLAKLIIALVIHAVRELIQYSSPNLVRQRCSKLVQLGTVLHTRRLHLQSSEDE